MPRMRLEEREYENDPVTDAMNVMQDLIDTLQLLIKLRNQCPYRSRGHRILNNAAIRLIAWFWLQAAEPVDCVLPASCNKKRRAA